MTKKMMLGAILAMCVLASAPAYAHEMGEGGMGHGMKGKQCQSQCPIAAQLEKTTHVLLSNKADLNLTEDQVKAIKDIDLQADKAEAQQGADAKVFMLDLKSSLDADKIDVDAGNALIDKNFATFAAAAKTNLAAYAKLKAVLTPEQSAKLKELREQKMKEWKNKEHGGKNGEAEEHEEHEGHKS